MGDKGKWSPGPWHADEDIIVPEQFVTNPLAGGVWDRSGDLVAAMVAPFAVPNGARPFKIAAGNARLIAAAPEMVALLGELAGQAANHTDGHGAKCAPCAARALLARIEGEWAETRAHRVVAARG